MEPEIVGVASDDDGIALADLEAKAAGARFLYLLPNFQNPTGRTMSEARRAALSAEAARLGLPIVEDNPYGDLWFDTPPPLPLTARNPEGCVYMGSFSKILAPGLRLGFMVAPKSLYPKLLQAKQAADLHTPGFNQRIVHEVVRTGFLQQHLPQVRARYKAQRDAMATALAEHLGPLGARWTTPAGGMFFWVELPAGLDAHALLPQAVDAGVAYVPGAAFYAEAARPNTLRLSFVTVDAERIRGGVRAIGEVLRGAMK
jgi:2-aminoadipate transaminase